jgi:ATP-dependent Clp protease ATP-binding subunit ClpA
MVYKFTKSGEKVLELANEIAFDFDHNYIGTEHILYALCEEENGVASKVLENQSILSEDVLTTLGEERNPTGHYANRVLFQLRETREYTDRELLADALDSVATSEDDRKKLTQYKKKVAEADELDRTLSELRAKKKALEEAKAKRSEIRAVQDEITKTQNRITIIDKQLFNLESTTALKRVLGVEKIKNTIKRAKAIGNSIQQAIRI